jgi:MFS family permease
VTPFLTLVLAGFLARFGYQMARSPVLPRFAQDLEATPELIGLIVAASTITGVIIKLPAGALSDLLGRKQVMLLGCFFFAGPPFLYPFVESPHQLLALRFLHGFATATFSPVAAAYIADLAEGVRGEKLGWYAAVNDLGGTLGPLVGGMILFYAASYGITYLTVGLIGLFPLFLVLRLPDEGHRNPGSPLLAVRAQQFWQGILEVLGSRSVLIASSLEAVMYLGYGAFLGFFPIYGKSIGFNDAEIAVIMGGHLATTMLAKPLSGRLSDHLGRKPMILVGLILCAITLPLIPGFKSFWALFFTAALFGLGVAIVTPSTTALVADLARTGRMGSAMGVFGTIWDSGEALGPILAGFLIASFSYAPAFSIIAAFMAMMAVVFLVGVRDPRWRAAGAEVR